MTLSMNFPCTLIFHDCLSAKIVDFAEKVRKSELSKWTCKVLMIVEKGHRFGILKSKVKISMICCQSSLRTIQYLERPRFASQFFFSLSKCNFPCANFGDLLPSYIQN